MKFRLSLLNASAILIALLSSNISLAQSELMPSPYSQSYLREVFSASAKTGSSNSESDLESIPRNVIYRIIFKEIQQEQALNQTIDWKDAQIILDLPAHDDSSFLEPELAGRADVCLDLDLLGWQAAEGLLQTAQKYDNIRKAKNLSLDEHYQSVIAKLSESGKDLVRSKYKALIGTNKLTYSEVSVEAIHDSAPLVAMQILKNNCRQIDNWSKRKAGDKKLLIHERRRSIGQVALPVNGSKVR